MPRTFVLVLFLPAAGLAVASLSSLVSAWGHDVAGRPFEAREMIGAMAPDKATGAKFNLVKMPNGHLMAVVPLRGMEEPPEVDPKDPI